MFEFDNWPQSAKGRANRNAREPMFGDRRVDDPFGPEFVQQPLTDLVSALIFGDLFTHQEDAVVAVYDVMTLVERKE